MADEQIRIDITADDDASKVLEDVADEAEQLEDLTPEIVVAADTDTAKAGIADVTAAAETLSRQDTEIVLRARIDDAKGALKALRDDLDQTGEKAETTARQLDRVGGDGGGGLQTRGNAIADLTGPLGEASSAASDFAGVFDGLGDIASDVASKLGASQQTAGQVAGAMGALGIVVAGAAAGWAIWTDRQKKAKEAAEATITSVKKLNDALDDQDARAWAEQFIESFPKAKTAAEALGLSLRDTALYITGQADEIPRLEQALIGVNAAFRDAGLSEEDAAAKTAATTDTIVKAREAYGDAQIEIGKTETAVTAVSKAMPDWGRATEKVTDAVEDNTEELDDNWTAQDRIQNKAKLTADAFDKINRSLDMDQAAADFRVVMEDALFWVRNGADLTDQHIRDIRTAIADVAEYAGYTPIEVRSLLERIDNGDVDAVVQEVNHRLETNAARAQVDLHPPTASEYAAMNREIQRGIGTIYLTAALNQIRSGAYGGP